MFIKKVFPSNFTYNDYFYITIDFMHHVATMRNLNSLTKAQIIDNYINAKLISSTAKIKLADNLMNNDYSKDEIVLLSLNDTTLT